MLPMENGTSEKVMKQTENETKSSFIKENQRKNGFNST